MNDDNKSTESKDGWQSELDQGNEFAFRDLVEPHMQDLLKAARRKLDFYIHQGDIQPEDYTPEEVVGETLIRAWAHRTRRPTRMSLRGWLFGTQYRVVRGMVEQQKSYNFDKAISLDDVPPPDPAETGVEEQFWEWHQPDIDVTWEDIIPGQRPVDYEPSLLREKAVSALPSDAYHVIMMHDEFEMTLDEVASSINRPIDETAQLLETARTTLRAGTTGTDDTSPSD